MRVDNLMPTPPSKDETRKHFLKCRVCSVDLILGDSWTVALKNNRNRICKSCHKRNGKNYRNSLLGKLQTYKIGARRRGYIFDLSVMEFADIIVQPCYYCGAKNSIYNGVDRKDNSIGYIRENCVSCCMMCNHMKQEYNSNEYIEKCMEVANYASS